ncbi:7897_t:CDS:2 [Entrophospora sp. SA101]|nr:5908_t:CDS:2 [Entrophospora candida]CAJ0826581.1 7897_t:CDS:2 [Entrophospora sp. SA101]
MTEVSRWASESWGSENDEIKEEFKEFAKKVASIYRQKVKEALTTQSDYSNANDNNGLYNSISETSGIGWETWKYQYQQQQ